MHPSSGRLIFALLVGLGVVVGELRAATVAPAQPATVIAVQVRGTVEVQHDKSTATEIVAEGAQLGAADTITTAAQSSVMLVIPNGSVVALREKSRLKIAVALQSPAAVEALAANETEPREPGVSKTSFELAFGEMLTRVRKLNPTSTFTVQTPVSVAAVRGTVFEISFQPDAKGEAHYRLSTASGLVHVTPHTGKMVAVPGNQQVDLTAEFGKSGIKIKNLKSSKLAHQKQQQLETEATDNEHNAGEFLQRAQQAGAAAKAKAAAQATGNAPGAATDKPTPGPGPTGAPEGSSDRAAKPAIPPTSATPAATDPTTSTNRPATPKVPPKPVKRPPRRPGT